MDVMRRLGGGPERQLAVGTEVRERGVLLEREVRVALVEKEIVVHPVRPGESGVEISKLHRDELVKVVAVAVFVDRAARVSRRPARSSRSGSDPRTRPRSPRAHPTRSPRRARRRRRWDPRRTARDRCTGRARPGKPEEFRMRSAAPRRLRPPERPAARCARGVDAHESRMRAQLRRSLQWSIRGSSMSSANRVCPVTFAAASTLT